MKPFDKAIEIEKVLIRRMEERYREGNVCDEVADFFEGSDECNNFPVIVGGKKGKSSGNLRGVAGEGALGRGPGDVTKIDSDTSYPPSANRGVTFHGPENQGQNTSNESPRIMGGYDGGVTLGFDGHWNKIKFTELKEKLQKAKDAANQDENSPDRYIELDGKQFIVYPNGAGGGVTYSYIFEGDGVKYYVHSDPKKGIQPMRMVYNAEGLIGRDIFHKHFDEVLPFINSLGFTVTQEKLSRVDLQVMLHRDVEEFMSTVNKRWVVCTSRKYSFHGDGFNKCSETFKLGREIQICVYDKGSELFSAMRNNPVKWALMVENCFGREWLESDIPVTRVEFRLQRSVLKSMGIDSMQDLLESEAGLARYCCYSWFRLLKEPKKKGHTHEQEVSDFWREVQEAFEKWFPGVDGHRREVKRSYDRSLNPADNDGLLLQASGCLSSYIARKVGEMPSVAEAVSYIVTKLTDLGERIYNRSVCRSRELFVKSGFVLREPESVEDPRYACSPDVLDRIAQRFGVPPNLCNTF